MVNHLRLLRRLSPGLRGLLLLTIASACLLGGCPGRQPDEEIIINVSENGEQGATVTHDRIAAEAKGEGSLVLYTSLAEANAQALLQRFRNRYPFINTSLVRGSTFTITRRADTEAKTGRPQCDVLHVLDVAAFIDLKRRGELYRYVSPEEKAFPDGYKDSGYWTTMRAVTLCIAYNPRKLKPDQAPKTWQDLLQPRWQGKIGMKDASTAGTAYTLYYFLRDLYGSSYWRNMAKQKPRIYRSASDAMDGLERGEISIACGVTGAEAHKAANNGKPVVGVTPAEGLPMMLGPVAIGANAPHPNCAKLFVDFCLSEEGQKVLCNLSSSYSVRPDVPAPSGQTPLASLNLLAPTGGWDAYYQAQDSLQAEYSKLLRSGGGD